MISQGFTSLTNGAGISKKIPVFLLILLFAGQGIRAQDDLNVIRHTPENGWINFTDASNSLYHFLASQSYVLLEKRSRIITGLHSLPDWQERQTRIRNTLLEIVGPFPDRTPLNPKIVRTIQKEGFRVEHIIFESQPGFFVTSSLFIPALQGRRKAPAVIYCSGHTSEGYRSQVYQHVILNLVKKGFVVFAFDPVGQGERSEYLDPVTGKPSMGETTNEHSFAGAQAFISGSSYARYMIWDGIRAVDYLVTRKEVDPARIGITGRSGGGTQSAFIAAFDDRIYAAAPECYITSFTRLLQSIGPQDAEQNMYHEILNGIDHADLLMVRAPRPALIISTTRDFFSIQGVRETAREIRKIYQAYDREENFGTVEDDAPHESTRMNREAMYAFFQKNLDNPGSPGDLEVAPLSNDEIKVTATGQVASSYKGETVFSLNCRDAGKLIEQLKNSRNNLPDHLTRVLDAAKKLSGYRDPGETNAPVFTGRIHRPGYAIEKYFMKGESDYVIPFLLIIPEKPNNKGLIYLHPEGKSGAISPGQEIEWFAGRGFTVLAPDLIGTGETGPGDFTGDSYINGHSYNMWFASILIGRSILGIQAGDVVRLARYLGKQPTVSVVYGLAVKEMAPVLIHAAAFDPTIDRIALIEPYSSYRCLVMNRFYNPAFIQSTVPGALQAYDLPDLSATLAPRKLMMTGITDCTGTKADPATLDKDLPVVRAAYHYRSVDEQFLVVPERSGENRDEFFLEWIK
jgi:hypothetical protein